MKIPGQRLWLVPLVLVLASVGAWYSARQWSLSSAQPVDLTDGRPKLLDFGMGVCEQCRRLRPVMEQATRELGDKVDVHVLDIRQDENDRLAQRFRMVSMPLIVLVDGAGKELWRHDGFLDFSELSRTVSERLVIP
jgi:thioredoxin 1